MLAIERFSDRTNGGATRGRCVNKQVKLRYNFFVALFSLNMHAIFMKFCGYVYNIPPCSAIEGIFDTFNFVATRGR